jgi:uncharacterized RDD family membrane protein YckC
MTCPSCGGELDPRFDRCPVCEPASAPRVEGALAADPRFVTPQPRARVEPMRDIPGLRRKEKTWRDEVQERVKSRRQKRASAGLPLFDRVEADEPGPAPSASQAAPSLPAVAPPAVAATAAAAPPQPAPPTAAAPAEAPRGEDFVQVRLSEAELGDLPLNAEEGAESEAREHEARALPRATRRPARPVRHGADQVPSLDDDGLLQEGEAPAEVELPPLKGAAPPLERPALALERAQAAAVDAVLFAALTAVVVYFTGRAARVDVPALAPSWPFLALYLGLLALFYAGYFTGTTGQTPGKLMTGLRVVGVAGRPPSYLRAIARALIGLAGIALAGAFLVPMVFDPARRALHDRLFRTRVVRG